jgi:hypothetical protein
VALYNSIMAFSTKSKAHFNLMILFLFLSITLCMASMNCDFEYLGSYMGSKLVSQRCQLNIPGSCMLPGHEAQLHILLNTEINGAIPIDLLLGNCLSHTSITTLSNVSGSTYEFNQWDHQSFKITMSCDGCTQHECFNCSIMINGKFESVLDIPGSTINNYAIEVYKDPNISECVNWLIKIISLDGNRYGTDFDITCLTNTHNNTFYNFVNSTNCWEWKYSLKYTC